MNKISALSLLGGALALFASQAIYTVYPGEKVHKSVK